MTDAFTVSPLKVHVLSADATEVEVEDIIQNPEVQLDPSARSIRVSADDRIEQGNIEGELIASARGLKITCGVEGDERKSLHLAFSAPEQLDDLVTRLQGAGLSVTRSEDDPEFQGTA